MKQLYVTGIGPGGMEDMTLRAYHALEKAEVVVGYPAYLDLVRPMFREKEYLSTPMRQEKERCRLALESAMEGKTTCLVSSGDAGIYGMAGIVLDLAGEYPDVDVSLIPGVTAANGAAALLGAPLMNDFAVVSLSDDLTPWTTIEQRLRGAAAADLVLVLYNPKSRHRPENLSRAAAILLDAGHADAPCGLAGRIGRQGQWTRLTTLKALPDEEGIDMFTTVVIGNSSTFVRDGQLLTPRGYRQ